MFLGLAANLVEDVGPLASLTNLVFLNLDGNQITDVSPLSALTNLRGLNLNFNQISDIDALSALLNLEYLDLDGNQVGDISALVANSGINEGDEVYLCGNPLSEYAQNTDIPALQDRGVYIAYDVLFSLSVDVEGSGRVRPVRR